MATRKRNPASSPRRQNTSKKAAAKSVDSLRKQEVDALVPGTNPGGGDSAPPLRKTGNDPDASPREAGGKPVRYFVGREGVAFGPYTECQVRESVRLGIFESQDLALAEDGKEWLEICQVLPVNAAPRERQPAQPLATPSGVEDGRPGTEASPLPPRVATPREQPLPNRARCKPLSEQQLREHEMLSCHSPVPAFVVELTHGRLAFAAIPVAVIFLALLTLAAAFKSHEPSVAARAQPRSSATLPAAPAPGRTHPSTWSGDLSPFRATGATPPEKLTASTQTPDAVAYQIARAGHAP